MIAMVAMSSCDALPRDPDNTLDRIRHERTLRVGIMPLDAAQRPKGAALVEKIALQTGARPHRVHVSGEAALAALDTGQLDLVIGAFDKASPWKTQVAFGPPLAQSGTEDHPILPRAAMRNGENRWIMLVEDASRSVTPQ